ncbi:hypothetical protein [Spiroplasma diminutum]|uniref:Uncharacterized protein n=1 Tax=Spiroplasma diminutum CUAS-1 TaxID=1276221 RepID=S5M0X7_9MOLU|nr:hypothetical protein [Spiroplasma diminutum]AGR42506.1 hypothetical protein SDIMI_v3c08020 [Spiroplasma diminutum CUAS-1]
MKTIKQINYEKIIVKRVNTVYENLKVNIGKEFKIPKNIEEFINKNSQLSTREEIELFGQEFDKTFGDWIVLDGNQDKLIILNHLMSILQNSIIVLISIDVNLEKENVEKEVINNSKGIDIIVATAVQAFGVKTNELLEKYKELDLDQDTHQVFKSINEFLKVVSKQDAQAAFAKLMDNILEFNQNYNNSYKRASNINEDELSSKRIEIFMEYMNTYYLMVFLLELILIYPLQEGMMNQQVFDNIMPNIVLYN